MLGSFRSGLNLSSGVDGARYGIHVPYCVSYCGGGRFWRWDGEFEGVCPCAGTHRRRNERCGVRESVMGVGALGTKRPKGRDGGKEMIRTVSRPVSLALPEQ
jgi:hypothetical protein